MENTETIRQIANFKTAEKLNLSKEDVVNIFKEHQFFTRRQLTEKHDFSLWFSKRDKINAVTRIFNHVVQNLDEYEGLITEKEVNETREITSSRSAMGVGGASLTHEPVVKVKNVVGKPITDMNKKVETIVKKFANILDAKLDSIDNKKELQKIRLTDLTTGLGTMIDKNRLMKGEATQHVAHIISDKGVDKMDKDDLLDALTKQRTLDVESKI